MTTLTSIRYKVIQTTRDVIDLNNVFQDRLGENNSLSVLRVWKRIKANCERIFEYLRAAAAIMTVQLTSRMRCYMIEVVPLSVLVLPETERGLAPLQSPGGLAPSPLQSGTKKLILL